VRVGLKRLGFADVETGEDGGAKSDAGSFVLVKGASLPIKFRIQRNALCDRPLTGPCTSAAVNLVTGGTVAIALPFSTAPSGVTIPPQDGTSPTVNITVQTCPNLNDRVLDLPTFGSCVRVTSDPPLPGGRFVNAATVFICDLGPSLAGRVASEAQEKRITLHKLDIVEGGPVVTALPHAGGCPTRTALAAPSFGRLLRAVASAEWTAAAGQLAGLAGPRTLYANALLDQGGGGVAPDLSDFQFALPAKMEKVPATDNQSALPGTTLPVNPKVVVTDLGNEPVSGARVTFATTFGSVTPTTVLTGTDGSAQAAWTLSGSAGSNSLKASGRGIAGADFRGPRPGINNPFQPISSFFDNTSVGAGPVTVLKGSQTFTAIGGIRVAGVGANSGNRAANVVFSSGDLAGNITRLTEVQFNALTPAQLRAAYDVLIITWNSATTLNVDWATRLQPYLALGGGVIFEDPNNVGQLAALVGTTVINVGGESSSGITVTTPVAGLTDGITGFYDNNHIRFVSFHDWNPALRTFLGFTTGPNAGAVVGLYGRFGAGCIVLTGPDQDYHSVRGGNAAEGNQYNLLVNEIRFVRSCP